MEKFDQSYIKMAGVWALNSYCKRLQVGALIVKDRMIISDGYNSSEKDFAQYETYSFFSALQRV